MRTLNDYELLYRVAHYYFINGYSQIDISRMENLSRPQVSRMIARARELGMVRVEVLPYQNSDLSPLEDRLRRRLGIDAVHIFPADKPDSPDSRFISALGAWLSRELPQFRRIGLARSRTVYRVSFRLIPQNVGDGMCFTPLQGNAGTNIPWLQSSSILDRFASNFNAEAVFTQCSVLTPTEALDTPLEQERFRLLQSGWNDLDAALFGIGAKPDFNSSFIREVVGPVYPELLNMDPTGDLFGSYFDENGKMFDSPAGYTLVSFPVSDLRTIPHAICVAAGAEKAQAICVAARQGYIKTLAVDETAAYALLRQTE